MALRSRRAEQKDRKSDPNAGRSDGFCLPPNEATRIRPAPQDRVHDDSDQQNHRHCNDTNDDRRFAGAQIYECKRHRDYANEEADRGPMTTPVISDVSVDQIMPDRCADQTGAGEQEKWTPKMIEKERVRVIQQILYSAIDAEFQ